MAGTDTSKTPTLGGPAIILVEPQLGENIGTAARAMLNFGLTDLRLVRPRDGWPSDKAMTAASGADAVVEAARVYDTTAEAVADLTRVYAATARTRDAHKATLTAAKAAHDLRTASAHGEASGVLFGPERAGLDNDDVALADALLMVPVNPAFSSLNLAQAVLLVGYEWFAAGDDTAAEHIDPGATGAATKADLVGLFEHLERELHEAGFLYPPEKAPGMARNIRNLFQRAGLSEREVKTLRGIVSALARKPPD